MATVKIKLRGNRLNSKGQAPLVIRVIQDRKFAEASLKKFINPSYWNQAKDELRKTHPHYSTLSIYLDREKYKVESIINQLRVKDEDFSARKVIQLYTGAGKIEPKTVEELIKYHVDHNPDGLAWGTLKYYETTANRWKECHPNLSVAKLQRMHLEKFHNYLKETCGNDVNTIYNRMKVVKKITRKAHRDGLLQKDPFLYYQLQTKESKRSHLNKHDLALLESYKPKTDLEKEVKDVFLFACNCGLRFSDCCTLTSDNFQRDSDINGNFLRLQFRMAKNQRMLSFRLPKKCEVILEQYRNEDWQWSLPILRKQEYLTEASLKNGISARNALYNRVLKTIASELKMKKHISFHLSRHTFAVQALSLEVSMPVLSKLLGHGDLKTTQIYAKVLDKAKDEAISKLDKL